jgi:hypothetical protein
LGNLTRTCLMPIKTSLGTEAALPEGVTEHLRKASPGG